MEEMRHRAGCEFTRDRTAARLKAIDDELLSRKAKGDCPQKPRPTASGRQQASGEGGQSFLPGLAAVVESQPFEVALLDVPQP